MRSAIEIEMGFRAAVQAVTDSFIGEKLTQDTIDRLQAAVTDAALDYYMDLTEEEINAYKIQVPQPKAMVHGNAISIERGFR